MIRCESCGAGMRYEPSIKKLKCDYCNLESEIKSEDDLGKEASEEAFFESYMYICPECGGEILHDNDTAVTFCSYCGASVALSKKLVKMAAPSYIIPFAKTQEEAKAIFKKSLKRSLFVPKHLYDDENLEKVRGIYMPFWLFDVDVNAKVNLQLSRSDRKGDYIVTKSHHTDTKYVATYKGVAFDASSSLRDEISENVMPFDFEQFKPFNEAYMAGFYADVADVEHDVYEEQAKKAVAIDLARVIVIDDVKMKPSSTDKLYSAFLSGAEVVGRRIGYFPAWFLTCRKGDYISYAVVNGQSGNIVVDAPIDYKIMLKWGVFVAAILAVCFNLFFSPTPLFVAIVGIVFAWISILANSAEVERLYRRENMLDDAGLMSVKKGEDKIRRSGLMWKSSSPRVNSKELLVQKAKVLIKPVIAMILGFVLLFVDPVKDMAYYGFGIALMILVLASLNDVVIYHNKIKKIRPTQLGKRGGDQ